MFRPGPANLITDVAGLKIGNADDKQLKSGVSVVVCENPAVASMQVLGGAPGTRDTDLLEPHMLVEAVNAIVLSGGSAFGLDAASGVQAALREMGQGFEIAGQTVPIVPTAILFDLANGGNKNWGRYPPYRELGYEAMINATQGSFPLGTTGAGAGATTAGLKGGLGSASTVLSSGITIGALAAVNAAGSVTIGGSGHFWAAPFEIGDEFGGLGLPSPLPADTQMIKGKSISAQGNTTIAVIATDAKISKAAAKRLAIAAHDGFTRAIWPAHTPLDGDLVFALATGRNETVPDQAALIELHAAAGATMARAIARGVFHAAPADGDLLPSWQQRYEQP